MRNKLSSKENKFLSELDLKIFSNEGIIECMEKFISNPNIKILTNYI